MVTALIVAYNELENIKLAVNSFRLFCDIEISLIIVDNGSNDGLQEWAANQTDLTYVYLDEGHVGYGTAINMVRRELNIHTDLLVMDGGYILTPRYLSRMLELLYSEENIGAVGGMYNTANRNQDFSGNVQSYKEAVEMAYLETQTERKRTVMLFHGAILWKADVLNRIGKFAEEFNSAWQVVDDYCLRAVMQDIKFMVCSNAFLWKMENPGKAYESSNKEGYDVLENKWGIHYFAGSYNKALCWAIDAGKEDKISVMEIGCACGATLVEIKNRYPNAEVYGSEINDKAAEIAGHFGHVIVNNIEDKNLSLPRKKFDYILLGDILEHLHDPLDTLIYCREFLHDNGSIIATIPNVMHISVMEQLLKGNFTYTEVGLLDKTHIHMFTYNEIIRMFHQAGFHVHIDATTIPVSEEQKTLIDRLISLEDAAEQHMYEAYQYIVKAKIIC